MGEVGESGGSRKSVKLGGCKRIFTVIWEYIVFKYFSFGIAETQMACASSCDMELVQKTKS